MLLVEPKSYLTLPTIRRMALKVPLKTMKKLPVKLVRQLMRQLARLAKQLEDSRQIFQYFKARKSTKRARSLTRRVNPLASLPKVRTSRNVQARSPTRRVLSSTTMATSSAKSKLFLEMPRMRP